MDIPPRRRIGCGRSCCARAGKVAECDHCNGPNGRHRGKSLSEPSLCKTPPHIYHPMFRLSPGDGSRNICRLGRSIGSNDWDDRKLGNPEPNTVNSTRWAIRVVISESVERQRGTAGSPAALKIVTAHSRSAQNLGEQRGVQCYAQRRGPLTLRKVY